MKQGCNCSRLKDKVAIVTASTAGIGYSISLRLASEGAKVAVCSRKQENVDSVVSGLRCKGLDVIGTACHVGSLEDIKALVKFTLSGFQTNTIDILVSNAAVNPAAGPILETDDVVIDKILDINVKSAIQITREVEPYMPERGSIVFISSYTAFSPSPPIGMYAVSKTALLGLTKALAEELGPERNIRVNCVAPGIVPTKFASALVATDEMREYHESKTLLRKLGSPEQIAAVVAMLCSEDGSYVTGETIVVAGGMQSRL